MNNNSTKISVFKLSQAFEKIYKGLNKMQVTALETEELFKVIPSHSTEVFMASGYDNDDNTIGLSVYISNPLKENNSQIKSFDKIMNEYLQRSDTSRFENIMQCINLMESKGKDKYTLDFIPVFYNEDLKEYYLHLSITKEL